MPTHVGSGEAVREKQCDAAAAVVLSLAPKPNAGMRPSVSYRARISPTARMALYGSRNEGRHRGRVPPRSENNRTHKGAWPVGERTGSASCRPTEHNQSTNALHTTQTNTLPECQNTRPTNVPRTRLGSRGQCGAASPDGWDPRCSP